jgi:beta-phosphoglucomutase
MVILTKLRKKGIKIAVGSSSKNTPLILERIGLKDYFDVVVDGNDLTKSKPDPEVFLLAAERLRVAPAHCVVVEDADAGVEAALAAGMRVVGVGTAADNPRVTWRAATLAVFCPEEFCHLLGC